MSDIGIEKTGHALRPPNNFFDIPLIKDIADAFESFDGDSDIRAIVLAAQGKAFCAGANYGDGSTLEAQSPRSKQVRDAAIKLAAEIGENSPLGLIATRMTMRGGIADRVREATDHE